MLTSLFRCLKSWSCLIWGSKYCAHILKSECQQASISPPCWGKVEYEIRCNNCLLNKNKKLFVKKQDRDAGWLVDWGCYWLVRSFTSGIYRVWQVLEPLIQWMEAAGENDSPQNNSWIYLNCTVYLFSLQDMWSGDQCCWLWGSLLFNVLLKMYYFFMHKKCINFIFYAHSLTNLKCSLFHVMQSKQLEYTTSLFFSF